jgi:hypothetical protein
MNLVSDLNPVKMETAIATTAKPPKLLDQVRAELRLRHYSLRTEKAYTDWIRRYVKFHQMRQREDARSAVG